MSKLKSYFTGLAMAIILVACSDPISEFENELIAPEGNPQSTINVIPGSITQQFGSGSGSCTEYYVYAIAAGGSTVNFDRKVRITIIKDATTDPDTGIPIPPAELEQFVLTIPAGAYVSPDQRVLANAQEEYDQDFTYKVEEITDAFGNSLTGYTLYERTYNITGNCYTDQGPDGPWSDDFKDCTFSGGNAHCG